MHPTLNGLAGDSITNSAKTMVRIANLLQIAVDSKFNDVTLLAYPSGNAQPLIDEYTQQAKSTQKFKYASSGAYNYNNEGL